MKSLAPSAVAILTACAPVHTNQATPPATGTRNTVTEKKCERVTVEGIVLAERDQTPVEGAVVAFIRKGATTAEAIVQSAADGTFRECLEKGNYAVTVTHTRFSASYHAPEPLADRSVSKSLQLGNVSDSALVRGQLDVVDHRLEVDGTYVRAIRIGNNYGDIFYAATTGAKYEMHLPSGHHYIFDVEDKALTSVAQRLDLEDEAQLDITVASIDKVEAPLPSEAVEALRSHSVRLSWPPESDDWEELRELLSQARIVAGGENSHGAKELLEHRRALFQYLAANLGFHALALEADFGESLAINEYVLGGKGKPRELLRNLDSWPWYTLEAAELLEWMRQHNDEVGDDKKLTVYGLDVQSTGASYEYAHRYLTRVQPSMAESLNEDAGLLATNDEGHEFSRLPWEDPQREQAESALVKLIERMDADREILEATTSSREWNLARQSLVALLQAVRRLNSQKDYYDLRDAAMAENALWVSRFEDTNVFILGHNRHIARKSAGWRTPMGRHLADELGDHYVAIGSLLHDGVVRAVFPDEESNEWDRGAIDVGPSPPGYVETTLADALEGSFAASLRRLLEVPSLREWLRYPHPVRHISARFTDNESSRTLIELPEHFDAILFVPKVSATTFLHPSEPPAVDN